MSIIFITIKGLKILLHGLSSYWYVFPVYTYSLSYSVESLGTTGMDSYVIIYLSSYIVRLFLALNLCLKCPKFRSRGSLLKLRVNIKSAQATNVNLPISGMLTRYHSYLSRIGCSTVSFFSPKHLSLSLN